MRISQARLYDSAGQPIVHGLAQITRHVLKKLGLESGAAARRPWNKASAKTQLDAYRSIKASPDGAPLSPRKVLLADLGQNRTEFTVNYADGISGRSNPPQLVTERIGARERQQILAGESRNLEEEMSKAMALSCPRCNSAPGALCRSRAGKETTMHRGRYPAVS